MRVTQNGLTLEFYPFQTKDKIIIEALGQNGLSLQYAGSRLRQHKDIVLLVVAFNQHTIQYASDAIKYDRAIIQNILNSEYGCRLTIATMSNKEMLALAINTDPTVVLHLDLISMCAFLFHDIDIERK